MRLGQGRLGCKFCDVFLSTGLFWSFLGLAFSDALQRSVFCTVQYRQRVDSRCKYGLVEQRISVK